MSQVHQPRSAPTKQEDGLTGFIAAIFLTTDLSDLTDYCCHIFNNGFNGLIGFTATTFLTTDLTDYCCHFLNNGFNGLLLPLFFNNGFNGFNGFLRSQQDFFNNGLN